MTELIIKLRGEIQDSNFDEWKKALINQIQATPTELSSDDDYAAADDQIKQFKAAETAPKKAKQSAIEQAGDIQTLFDAIDEVSAETREIRLKLERQIKARRQRIKDDSVNDGIATIKDMIASQSTEFKLIDHSEYLDENLLEEAVKGRSSLRTMEEAVAKLTKQIAEKIRIRAELVEKNASALNKLDRNQQVIFQDRVDLLALSEEKLATTITERLDVASAEAKAPVTPATDIAAADSADVSNIDVISDDLGDDVGFDASADANSRYQIVITLNCEKTAAESIKELVAKALDDAQSDDQNKTNDVGSITLTEQMT